MDLNCDMGELGDAVLEAALMCQIRWANIACGGHAGNAASIERAVRLALAHGVRIGAHPGYPDKENFGRVEMAMTAEELADTVHRQIMRLDATVKRMGGRVAHVKPHGAMYHAAARNEEVARAIGDGVARWNPRAAVIGLAGSPGLDIWRGMGLKPVAEAFADRRYEPDGSLRSRSLPNALITSPQAAASQAVRLAREGKAQTICVHGDTPRAVEILKACREALLYEA